MLHFATIPLKNYLRAVYHGPHFTSKDAKATFPMNRINLYAFCKAHSRLSKKYFPLANNTSGRRMGNPSLGFPTAKPSTGRFGLPS